MDDNGCLEKVLVFTLLMIVTQIWWSCEPRSPNCRKTMQNLQMLTDIDTSNIQMHDFLHICSLQQIHVVDLGFSKNRVQPTSSSPQPSLHGVPCPLFWTTPNEFGKHIQE
jgi:hypothetical protein